jgi:ABC-type ATPase with predicted acetyltransferase domain
MKFTLSKSFSTRVEKSDRVLEVAEAFGLGLSDKQFVIYQDLDIDINPGDIVYVQGQSGSGKSVLLRELSRALKEGAHLKVMDLMDVPLLEKPLVDQIGRNTDEALKLLGMAGVNDAYLFVRKPSELSDGQKYRFRLAKLIEAKADVWIADEFAAVLDRETAKVVAFNVSKAARAAGATLIVATTHTDLLPFLGATLSIEKPFGDKVDVNRFKWEPSRD